MSQPKTDDLNIWSGDDSARVSLIKGFHREFGLKKWGNDQVGRLCRKMRCTIYALCALAGVYSKGRVDTLWKQSAKKGGGPWPSEITLHFERLDSFIDERIFSTPRIPDCGTAMAAIQLDEMIRKMAHPHNSQ